MFICIYKPIYNWICSTKKAPYDIKWNKTLTGKCTFIHKNVHSEYKNIIEIYNQYYNMYIELINAHKRVIFMNYYDIIDKKNIVKYLTNKLFVYNLSIKSDHNIFSILDNPSKRHGKSVQSSDDAINKKDKCYNEIVNYENNKIIIKKYFNYGIEEFFEH